MKHLFVTAVLALLSLGASAQSKTWEVGGKLNYGTDRPHFGIGAFARYNINDHFRPEATVNFYPKNDYVWSWDVNFNLHYLFPITDKFKLYPLGGLSVVILIMMVGLRRLRRKLVSILAVVCSITLPIISILMQRLTTNLPAITIVRC